MLMVKILSGPSHCWLFVELSIDTVVVFGTTGFVTILPCLIIKLASPASLRRLSSWRKILFDALSLGDRSGEINTFEYVLLFCRFFAFLNIRFLILLSINVINRGLFFPSTRLPWAALANNGWKLYYWLFNELPSSYVCCGNITPINFNDVDQCCWEELMRCDGAMPSPKSLFSCSAPPCSAFFNYLGSFIIVSKG